MLAAAMLCGGEAGAETRLVIISPHWEGIRREFAQAFERYYRDDKGEKVEIEWLEVGASSNILLYIRSEFSSHPDGIGVDLVWGGGSIYYRALAEDGLLEPQDLDPEVLGAVPRKAAGADVYDTGMRWFGTALSSFGILYNREVLKVIDLPEPTTWRDLADPVYHDWVVLADPRHSGTSHALFEIMLQAYGWEEGFSVITRSFANARTVTKASSGIPILIATGEAALGPAIDFYAWSKMVEVGEDRLGFALPTRETVINIDPIAVLKGPPNPEAARAFVEFVLSKDGQKLWMLPPGDPEGPERFILSRLSVRPDVYRELGERAVTRTDPFDKGAGLDFDDDLAASRWQTLNDLIGIGMIDALEELAEAFASIMDGDTLGPAFRRLGAPPESEKVFLARSAKWNDSAYRNEVITSWAEFFSVKYQGVMEMGGTGGKTLQGRIKGVLRYVIPALVLLLMLEVLGQAAFRRLGGIKPGVRGASPARERPSVSKRHEGEESEP